MIRTAVKHPKGGYVVTMATGVQYLRRGFGEWFRLPSFEKPRFFHEYESLWDSHCARTRYTDLAPPKKKVVAKAAPTSRCPFCHEDVILAKEPSLKCGACAAVTHKACVAECPQGCPTCRAPWQAGQGYDRFLRETSPVAAPTQVGLRRGVREREAAPQPPRQPFSLNRWLEKGHRAIYVAVIGSAAFAAFSFKLPAILKWVFG